ncbi:hypothetical protein KQI65_17180 [bacterium]|nr:hypothetical protein [bacterium]
MNARQNVTSLLLLTLLFLFGSITNVFAQEDGFRLKRTKKENVPINVQVLAGYNSMNNPADVLQDMYDGTNLTSAGGFATGLQGMVELDTLGLRVWLGAEVTYYRVYKRWLAEDPEVYYPGEDTDVDAVETLWGLGANAILAVGPFSRFTLIFGPGVQYLYGRIDKELTIEGNIFEAQIVPTMLGSVNFQLLRYEHGSIDANFRGLWGFGEYGSFQFQSLIGFTFNF